MRGLGSRLVQGAVARARDGQGPPANSIGREPADTWDRDRADHWNAVLRSIICHEDELTSHRMSWFLTIQGLLFTALGFSWNQSGALSLLLCGLGLAICASCRFALILGPTAVGQAIWWWDQHKPDGYDGPPLIPLDYQAKRLEEPYWPWNSLPLCLGSAWVVAAIIRIVGW